MEDKIDPRDYFDYEGDDAPAHRSGCGCPDCEHDAAQSEREHGEW